MFLQNLKSIFFHLPIVKFKIIGNSMYPTFKENDVVLINRFSYVYRDPKINDVVVIAYKKEKKQYIVKRIKKKVNKQKLFFVEGDNNKASTDSRDFGWITRDEIIGKVI